jgi:hypothetical protein
MHQAMLNALRKKQIFLKLQKKLKAKCHRRVTQRGQLMYRKVLLHVSKSVTKKKEEYERKASQVFADAYRKHIFRRALARRVRIRQSIVNFLYKFSLVLKLRKIYIAYIMTREIADRAFAIGKA